MRDSLVYTEKQLNAMLDAERLKSWKDNLDRQRDLLKEVHELKETVSYQKIYIEVQESKLHRLAPREWPRTTKTKKLRVVDPW